MTQRGGSWSRLCWIRTASWCGLQTGGVSGLAQADADPPDVIVLDVQMPGMDGYEVCRVLRHGKKTRGVPIVMLTACDDTSLNRQAFAAGAQMCVTKPFRREALVTAITVALQMTPE